MSETVPARNLRTAERYLLAPPLAGTFAGAAVAVCDISAKGVRFRHEQPLETGMKALMKLVVTGGMVSVEASIVWSHADASAPGRFVSGARTYGPPEVMAALIAQLQIQHRTSRIEELRSTERFYVAPTLDGTFDGQPILIEDLSARGARIETLTQPPRGSSAVLQFSVPKSEIAVSVLGEVKWTALKTIASARTYRAGLFVSEKPELLRLAIGRLCEINRAALDMQSLRLKLKILRARARQMAPSYRAIEASGIPAEQYLLIQGVREELRLNPDEALHWYRRARMIINDPATRAAAPPIASHPDALAVWEYLDRSVDPSIVGRAFELPLP